MMKPSAAPVTNADRRAYARWRASLHRCDFCSGCRRCVICGVGEKPCDTYADGRHRILIVFEAKEEPLTVEVFYQVGDPPFVIAVNGRITTDGLAEVEKLMEAEAELLFPAGSGIYLCHPTYESHGLYDEPPGGWCVEQHEVAMLGPLVPDTPERLPRRKQRIALGNNRISMQ